jgi:hypothetical protein
MTHEDITEYARDQFPGHSIMLMSGFESAFIGIVEQGVDLPYAIYDYHKSVQVLMEAEDMSIAQAIRHLEEIMDVDMGDYTPAFVRVMPSHPSFMYVN